MGELRLGAQIRPVLDSRAAAAGTGHDTASSRASSSSTSCHLSSFAISHGHVFISSRVKLLALAASISQLSRHAREERSSVHWESYHEAHFFTLLSSASPSFLPSSSSA